MQLVTISKARISLASKSLIVLYHSCMTTSTIFLSKLEIPSVISFLMSRKLGNKNLHAPIVSKIKKLSTTYANLLENPPPPKETTLISIIPFIKITKVVIIITTITSPMIVSLPNFLTSITICFLQRET